MLIYTYKYFKGKNGFSSSVSFKSNITHEYLVCSTYLQVALNRINFKWIYFKK